MDYAANFIFTLSVIFPLVALMAVGYGAKKIKLVSDNTVNECNKLVFKIFLPVLLFNNVRKTTLDSILNPSIFLFVLIFIILSFAVSGVFVVLTEKENTKRGVMIQAISRSNYAIFGLPLLELLKPNADLGIAAALVAVVIPSLNVLSVIVLTIFSNKDFNVKKIIKNVLTNNLIIGTVLGAVLLLLNVNMPTMLDSTFNYFGAVATPLALFMLGAKFDLKGFKRVGKQLIVICAGRLVVLPTLIITAAIIFGFRDVELACLTIIFYAPTAASSYVMAVESGGDSDLAAGAVVMTTLLSVITMFIVIFIFNGLGLI